MAKSNHWHYTAFDALAGTGYAAIWRYDPSDEKLYVNDALCRLYGCPGEDSIGSLEFLRSFVCTEDLEGLDEAYRSCFQDGKTQYSHNYRLICADGSERYIREQGAAVGWKGGKPEFIAAMLTDITHEKNVQNALNARIAHYGFVTGLSGAGGWTLDIQSLDFSMDEDFQRMLGFTPEEAKGTLDEVLSRIARHSDKDRFLNTFSQGLKNLNKPLTFEICALHKNGDEIWLQNTSMISQMDEEGNPLRITGCVVNVDEYRRNIDMRNELLRILNKITASLLTAQPDVFADTMKESMRLIGESADIDRINIWRNFSQDDKLYCQEVFFWQSDAFPILQDPYGQIIDYEHFHLLRETMLARQFIYTNISDLAPGIERDHVEKKGIASILIVPIYIHDQFWGHVSFDSLVENGLPGDAAIKMLQSAGSIIVSAIVRNETLEHLIHAREEALASDRAKTEFLSRMSHEIRTPMNAIIGMTSIARKTNDPHKIQDCLSKVDLSSRRLLGIINDVLDISKIDANKFEIVKEEFNFEKMLQNVQNVMQVKLEEKRQDFIYDFERVFDHLMLGDELRLSQVLINLLGNAVKFTPEYGTICLRVREEVISPKISKLFLEVEDDGIGISLERQRKLFQSFEQGDGTITRQFGGTGLGLSISKKIINLMGGEIWVESEEGVGSRFTVSLEVEWGPSYRPGKGLPKLKRGLRALVVDDSPPTLENFRAMLTSFSINTDTAICGEDAVALVRQSVEEFKPYDVVMIDWTMPGMNGGETARHVKQIMGPEVLIIMISVSEWNEIDSEAGAYGLRRFLQKPVLPSALYDTLLKFSEQVLEPVETDVSQPPAPDWGEKRILLVEDIEINQEIVICMLEDTKVQIETAGDGLEAINKFSANPERYDLIVMDVQMPILDGLSATRRIRALPCPGAKTIPIVAMTADAFKENEKECMEAGMNAYISKPIEERLMMATLARYL